MVVAGQSYSGLMVGQVADRAPDRVARTVFVQCFLPADGRSLLDVFSGDAAAHCRPAAAQWVIEASPVRPGRISAAAGSSAG